MWQMILDEMMAESFSPVREPMHIGSWAYVCPICKSPVGIYRSDEGMVYKRDKCKNGHAIRWEVADVDDARMQLVR